MKNLLLVLAALFFMQLTGCATTSGASATSASTDLPEIAPYDEPAIPPLDVEAPPVEPVA